MISIPVKASLVLISLMFTIALVGPVRAEAFPGQLTASAISSGENHNCAIRTGSSTVVCWGYNNNGQLGDGTTSDRKTPTPVQSLGAVSKLSAGDRHTCAIDTSGQAWCWGRNHQGQLGNNSINDSSVPVPVQGMSDAVEISAGGDHTCAIDASGQAWCWGNGFAGQLGDNSTNDSSVPVQVQGISDAVEISLGSTFSCAIDVNRDAYCWGDNGTGQLGVGDTFNRLTATKLASLTDDVGDIAAGQRYACAAYASTAYCWGMNDSGQIPGAAPFSVNSTPLMGFMVGAVSTVSTGWDAGCAVDPTGIAKCWGSNLDGELGRGITGGQYLSPMSLNGLSGVIQTDLGADHGCALETDGDVFCWGSNVDGQLGDGTNADHYSAGKVLPVGKFALDAVKTGTGTGTVTSSSAAIDCGTTCSAVVDTDATVTLTATADSSSNFTGWSGCDSVSGNECTVSMGGSRNVTANFNIKRYALDATKTGTGTGTVTSSPAGIDCGATCSAQFDHGTAVTLTATADASSDFTGWSGCDSVSGNECTVSMSEAKSVSANFELKQLNFSLLIGGVGGATVTSSPTGINCDTVCDADFDYGTVLTLTAALDPDTKIELWSGCDTITAQDECVVTMNAVRGVTLFTALKRHLLAVDRLGDGSGVVSSVPAGIDCGDTCSAEFDHGTEVTLTANPDPISRFAGWSGCDQATGTACVVNVNRVRAVNARFDLKHFSLSVVKTGDGDGDVTSAPAGIDCGSSCSADFAADETVTLTATPDSESELTGWSGCDSTNGDECEVSSDQAREVSANFELKRFTLDVERTGSGRGSVFSAPGGIGCSPDCAADYPSGTYVTLAAAPDQRSTFTAWTGCLYQTPQRNCVVSVDQDRTITAEFSRIQHPVHVAKTGSGSGTVTSSPAGIDCGTTCDDSFEIDEDVTLTATADADSELVGWSGCDTTDGNECTVTVDRARNVTAEFAKERRTLDVSQSGAGSGEITSAPTGIDCGPTCYADFDHGTEVTLSADPAADSILAGWSGCDSVSGNRCTVTLDRARSISAEFELKRYGLEVRKGGAGSGAVTSAPVGIDCGASCSADFDHGSVVTLTATADADSDFAGWSGCDSTNGNECAVTVDRALDVTANFGLKHYSLDVSQSGAGSGEITSSPAGIDCGTTCSADFDHGAGVTLSADPEADSTLAGWSGCDSTSGNRCTVTLDQARSVTANFELKRYRIEVGKSGGGSGTVTSAPAGIDCGSDCADDYPADTEIVLTATADANSEFAGWSGCDTTDGNECTVTADQARAVIASFTKRPSARFAPFVMKPSKRTLKRGERNIIKVSVRGAEPVEIDDVSVCVKAPDRLMLARRCVSLGTLAPGETGIARFVIRVRPGADRNWARLHFKIRGAGVETRRGVRIIGIG